MKTTNSPITKLPDGSAFFTATILSKEDAMALPVKERPICYRISSEMYHAVWESVAEASGCWKEKPSSDLFDHNKATKVATELCFKIANEVENSKALKDAQAMVAYKDETATTFMNQVKKLQKEIAELKARQ